MHIIRSATFEGMADKAGFPTEDYLRLYETLAKNGVKTMITGFMFISNEGRAMQPGQAGLDAPNKIPAFKLVTDCVHKYGAKIFAQIAHTGRQTTGSGYEIVGVSDKKSAYFNEKPRVLETREIYEIAEKFAESARYAKEAGFDGVQLHSAHGYLIHQFLLESLNNRSDEFKDGLLFLELIVGLVKEKCKDFPIWLKISGGVDIEKNSDARFAKLIKRLSRLDIDAIEVSYGTMDFPLNIFRGGVPVSAALRHNPIYRSKSPAWKLFCLPLVRMRIKKFTPMYNMHYAEIAKANTELPVFAVGGFRSGDEIFNCKADGICLCRPFICEPDFLIKLGENREYKSKCTNCNLCAIMTDTNQTLRCYNRK